MTRHLKWVIGFISLVLVAGLSIPGYQFYQFFYQPMPIQSVPTIIVLNKYSTAFSFVQDLKSRHLIESDVLFLKYIRFKKFTSKLKAGVYEIKRGESARDFLARVVGGDVIIKPFRIISGTTVRQISENLANAPYLNYNKADWLFIAQDHYNPEGLLLADTYHYDGGSQSKELLLQAHKNLQQYLEQAWLNRNPDLPYKTSYELLIAASILEKEAALREEKYLISGIIANRLKKHMRLQMDPTVIYALGADYKGKLTHKDLQIDSLYNTYRYGGLPPTPIAMVAKDAIDAAAHPTKTDCLYFVAKGDGTHQFSKTYGQQKHAIHRLKGKKHDAK